MANAILVVDDEAELRDILAEEFEVLGLAVYRADNGHKAREILTTEQIDVVISDVRMPKSDGLELLDFIQAMGAQRPKVFLMTGFADITREKAIERGAEGLFAKPFDLDEVLNGCSRALGLSD